VTKDLTFSALQSTVDAHDAVAPRLQGVAEGIRECEPSEFPSDGFSEANAFLVRMEANAASTCEQYTSFHRLSAIQIGEDVRGGCARDVHETRSTSSSRFGSEVAFKLYQWGQDDKRTITPRPRVEIAGRRKDSETKREGRAKSEHVRRSSGYGTLRILCARSVSGGEPREPARFEDIPLAPLAEGRKRVRRAIIVFVFARH
jgi:hypothetical protein